MVLSGPDHPAPNLRPQPELSEEEKDAALLDAVATRVVRMGLSVPAIFFLESTKPLSFIGSQALVFLEPFVKSIFTVASYDRFVALLEDRKNIEKLIQRIERLDDEAQKAEKERKRQEKREKKERELAYRAAGQKPPREPLGRRLRRWIIGS